MQQYGIELTIFWSAMDSVKELVLLIFGYIVIDFCARLSLRRSARQGRYKSAGIIALILMSLRGRSKIIHDKNAALKQFFLTALITVFLGIANFVLLKTGMPDIKISHFALLLCPLFIMPFFNFIYELFLLRPLSVNIMLANFHFRSILSLIISANVIFISMDPLQNILSVIGHFSLGYCAFLGYFYLCCELRQKPSPYKRHLLDELDYFEPSVLRYLASIMELFYYLLLLFYFFIEGPISTLFLGQSGFYLLCLSVAIMLLVTTIIISQRFILPMTLDISFYEKRVLPLSFLLFGLVNVIEFYF